MTQPISFECDWPNSCPKLLIVGRVELISDFQAPVLSRGESKKKDGAWTAPSFLEKWQRAVPRRYCLSPHIPAASQEVSNVVRSHRTKISAGQGGDTEGIGAIMALLLAATSLLEWLGASLEYENGWERAAPSLLFGDERAGIPQYKAMDKIRRLSYSWCLRNL